MTLSEAAVWRVYMRLRDEIRYPRLFDDRMPAGRVRLRLERFRRWCGPLLWALLCEGEYRGTRLAPGAVSNHRVRRRLIIVETPAALGDDWLRDRWHNGGTT